MPETTGQSDHFSQIYSLIAGSPLADTPDYKTTLDQLSDFQRAYKAKTLQSALAAVYLNDANTVLSRLVKDQDAVMVKSDATIFEGLEKFTIEQLSGYQYDETLGWKWIDVLNHVVRNALVFCDTTIVVGNDI